MIDYKELLKKYMKGYIDDGGCLPHYWDIQTGYSQEEWDALTELSKEIEAEDE